MLRGLYCCWWGWVLGGAGWCARCHALGYACPYASPYAEGYAQPYAEGYAWPYAQGYAQCHAGELWVG